MLSDLYTVTISFMYCCFIEAIIVSNPKFQIIEQNKIILEQIILHVNRYVSDYRILNKNFLNSFELCFQFLVNWIKNLCTLHKYLDNQRQFKSLKRFSLLKSSISQFLISPHLLKEDKKIFIMDKCQAGLAFTKKNEVITCL